MYLGQHSYDDLEIEVYGFLGEGYENYEEYVHYVVVYEQYAC